MNYGHDLLKYYYPKPPGVVANTKEHAHGKPTQNKRPCSKSSFVCAEEPKKLKAGEGSSWQCAISTRAKIAVAQKVKPPVLHSISDEAKLTVFGAITDIAPQYNTTFLKEGFMSKWADYLISAVRFNEAGTHIVKVKAHADNDDTVGTGYGMTRQDVISKIDDNITFATIYEGDNGKWKLGARVKTVTIDGTRYIKTHADGTKADNLDDLPIF